MIKIAMVLDDPGVGGAYKVAKEIGEGLDNSLYKVKYFFLCQRPVNPPEGIFLGTPETAIDYSLMSYLRLAFFPSKRECCWLSLNKEIAQCHPDIIHFHTHPIYLPLIRGAKKYTNATCLFTDHLQRIRHNDPILKRWLMARVYRRLFALTRVVFISEYAFRAALLLGFASKQKDILIRNTIDINKFTPPTRPCRKETKVVYLARLHPVKGHDLLLDAWKRLSNQEDLSLHLYGDEADGGKVRKRIESEYFPNPVYYQGLTATPEVVLQNAQIGVFSSYREGLPLALLEMMASGLAVVASDIPEIKNVVTDGYDGLLYPSGNAGKLAKNLLRLIGNESLRIRLGKQARRTVESTYGEPIALKYNQLYTKYIVTKASE